MIVARLMGSSGMPNLNIEAFTAGKVVHMKGRRRSLYTLKSITISPPLRFVGGTQWPSWFQGQLPVDVMEIRDYDVAKWFSKLKILSGNGLSEISTPGHDKGILLPIQPPRPNHHAFETGFLAYHTATMVRLADAISEFILQLNKSYFFYAGIMPRDLAKVIELPWLDQTAVHSAR